MRIKLLSLITGLLALGLLVYFVINIYELKTKTYCIDEAKLYRIDTFHLLGRAYEKAKYVNKYSSKSYLEFKSTNGYSFSIADKVFIAIKNKQILEDTLMYHNIKFTVYSDRKNYDDYQNNKEPIFIEVYQIQIGNTKYIDIPVLNKLSKSDRLLKVFCIPLGIVFFGILIHKTEGNNSWTLKKLNWFAVCCFLLFLIIMTLIGVYS